MVLESPYSQTKKLPKKALQQLFAPLKLLATSVSQVHLYDAFVYEATQCD